MFWTRHTLNTTQFVQATILRATGKASTLVSTDTKWVKIVGIANRLIRVWERAADWNSLYDPKYSGGTVTATDTFELDSDIRKLSDTYGDPVRIVSATDSTQKWDYTVVNAERLKQYSEGQYCAQIGRNLVFNREFEATDPQFGGTIELPVYLHATELKTVSTQIPVDDPEWLICMAAAEYVRNDITKQGQYPNLVQEANSYLDQMMDENDGQIAEPYAPWTPGV